MQRQLPELRLEGLRHKVPPSAVRAPARGRARPFVAQGGAWGLVRLKAHPTVSGQAPTYGVANGVGLKPDLRPSRRVVAGAVDSPGFSSISPPIPEAIPGFFIGVGGPRKGMPVGGETRKGQRPS